MTIEELKQHCIRTIRRSEAIESIPNVKITDSRSLQEHEIVLKLIEVWEKVKEEIREMPTISLNANDVYKADVLKTIDKYLREVEDDK